MCWKVQVRFLGGKGATRAPYLSDQQAISKIEQSESIENDILEKVAKILGVSVEGIKNFSEESIINYFNTFNDNSFNHSSGAFHANHCTFNPLDKVVELYERLVQAEKDKVDYLERLLKDKK